jgi:hypothetical protein
MFETGLPARSSECDERLATDVAPTVEQKRRFAATHSNVGRELFPAPMGDVGEVRWPRFETGLPARYSESR